MLGILLRKQKKDKTLKVLFLMSIFLLAGGILMFFSEII